MPTFTDRYGDKHEIATGLMCDTGERAVWLDNDPYSPAEARRLARELLAAADLLERPLIALAGGAA